MVQLSVARASNTSLVKSQPLVAVFVGGTSGIGSRTLRALAAAHGDQQRQGGGKGLRAYIVGRNVKAAEAIRADCVNASPGCDVRFVKAEDLSLLKDVDRVCAELLRIEKGKEEQAASGGGGDVGGPPRIDLLYFTSANILDLFTGREETKEGIDMNMSLLYYSRMRFITQLTPLLLASTLPAAHVVSVYAAGCEGALRRDDLSLRNAGHYSLANVRSHVAYMKTLSFERLAAQHPGRLSLVHVFPGLVITENFGSPGLPWWFKLLWRLVSPLAWLVSVSPQESGERTLFLASDRRFPARKDGAPVATAAAAAATAAPPPSSKDSASTVAGLAVAIGSDGAEGSGAYAVKYDGEVASIEKHYKKLRAEGFGQEVWDHTMRIFEEVEKTGVTTS